MTLSQEKRLFVFLNVLFLLLAVYTLQGRIFEVPSTRVAHFVAGACNFGLILLFPLALLICILSLKEWSDRAVENKGDGKVYLLFAVLPFLILFSILLGFQKWAPGYDEEAFTSVVVAYENGTLLSTDEVLDMVGPPLIQDEIDNGKLWSYTYMPSTGIGWTKRTIYFDEAGNMTGYYHHNELGPE
jgi:hypothetical protein